VLNHHNYSRSSSATCLVATIIDIDSAPTASAIRFTGYPCGTNIRLPHTSPGHLITTTIAAHGFR
jgi:hypothetical protein